ncbi:AMP-binding protein, partial [Streptomyces edwardsiae]
MSRFTEAMYANAHASTRGMVTGEPHAPVRHTWEQVHQRARRVAGGLAAAGVGRGDAIAVLAGLPVEVAPTAQAVWMRGASLTMLHQTTPRTDLVNWAAETAEVVETIDTDTVVLSEPFLGAE